MLQKRFGYNEGIPLFHLLTTIPVMLLVELQVQQVTLNSLNVYLGLNFKISVLLMKNWFCPNHNTRFDTLAIDGHFSKF